MDSNFSMHGQFVVFLSMKLRNEYENETSGSGIAF